MNAPLGGRPGIPRLMCPNQTGYARVVVGRADVGYGWFRVVDGVASGRGYD